jgi:hypothetical protein
VDVLSTGLLAQRKAPTFRDPDRPQRVSGREARLTMRAGTVSPRVLVETDGTVRAAVSQY